MQAKPKMRSELKTKPNPNAELNPKKPESNPQPKLRRDYKPMRIRNRSRTRSGTIPHHVQVHPYLMLKHYCGAKIGNFDCSILGDENILRLDVAMDHTMLVQVVKTPNAPDEFHAGLLCGKGLDHQPLRK